MPLLPPAPPRRFLFLQGPISPFFAELAAGLRALGHSDAADQPLPGRPAVLAWARRRPTIAAGSRIGRISLPAILERERITDLVLLGEQRPYHKVAIAAAKARGIAVTVTDYGYLRPDWIVLERDGMGAESRFPRDPAPSSPWRRTAPSPTWRSATSMISRCRRAGT